jgi:hypothetical protein
MLLYSSYNFPVMTKVHFWLFSTFAACFGNKLKESG